MSARAPRSRPTCFRGDRRGETALEFAIVGVLFVLLLLAPVEAGLMIWTGSSLQVAAAQTARCAAIGSNQCAAPQSYAASLANQWIGPGTVSASDVTVSNTTTCNSASGHFVQVTITASIWSGAMLSSIDAPSQTATACFPT